MSKLFRYDKPTKIGLRKRPSRRANYGEESFEVIRFGNRYGQYEVLAVEKNYDWAVEAYWDWVRKASGRRR